MIKVTVKINRNQDPKLYEIFTKAPNKSGLARDLLNTSVVTAEKAQFITGYSLARAAKCTRRRKGRHIGATTSAKKSKIG